MKFKRPDRYWLLICISAILFFSIAIERFDAFHTAIDYIPVYTGARCLLNGCNPYDIPQLDQQYYEAGGRLAEKPLWNRTPPVYPPSTFLTLFPLALLPFPVARAVWFLLNGCLYVLSAGIISSMCPRSHRWVAAILVSVILATSGIFLALGNPGLFSISLLIISSYLFLKGRYLPLAALLLMLSLTAKPQMVGLIVLYLLVKRIHWRYVVIAMAGALAILLSAGLILKAHPRSAEWPSALHANLIAVESTSGVNDPTPNSEPEHGTTLINLQAITAVFFPVAWEYNDAAYAIFLVLLAVLITANLRTNASPDINLLTLGALTALTLMPVYHRSFDIRLLLFTIPAVMVVFQKRRFLGATIGALTVISMVSIQSRAQAFLLHHAMWQSILRHKLLFILLLREENLELLIIFSLYIFAILTLRFPSEPENEFAYIAH
jgi:hypothetical protein